MTVADVLDGAFAIIKARPRKILGFTAGFVVPVSLVAAFFQRGALVGFWFSDDSALSSESSSGGGEVAAAIVLLIVPSIALVCVAAALAHLVSGWSVGRDASAREMLGIVGRRWWPLLGSFVVVHLAEAAGAFACYLGTLFVIPLFVPVAPIIGTEGASVGEALRRSVRLVRSRYFPVMGLALLMAVVSGLLGLALASLPQAVAVSLDSESAWPLLALGSIVSQIVTTPFVAAATVLLYLDLRVRTEGLDIELAAREVLDRAT
jgi:small-conductance mechanosensitive channel